MSLSRKAALGVVASSAAAFAIAGAGSATAADDQHGAMALSPSTGVVTSSVDHSSQANAEAGAKAECGVQDCKVVVTFVNACASVAQGADRKFGWAWAPTQVEADKAAVDGLGQSAPAFPDLGSASPKKADVILSACTSNAS